MQKPLSGREASVLALLAQSKGLSPSEKQRILSALNGQALKIARVIVGDEKRPARSFQVAAEGFTSWAKGMPPTGG